MNLLLVHPQELQGDEVRLTDFRAEHIRRVLGLRVGDNLRLGLVNGRLGQGTLLCLDDEAVRLAVQLDREPPPPPPLTFILALPRPIMLQRILKQAASLGVRALHLIRSAKVEKSFFHSPALKAEKIQERLLEGLSQAAVDTRLPEVYIHPLFQPFIQEILPKLTGHRLLAHPGVPQNLAEVLAPQQEQILLAVGPEGGWKDHELACFRQQGFTPFQMGQRILHVDTAVVALLAQIHLLNSLESKPPSV
jgi:RsmE family RNA methyltransferase